MLSVVNLSLLFPTDNSGSNRYHFLSMYDTVPLLLKVIFSFLLNSLQSKSIRSDTTVHSVRSQRNLDFSVQHKKQHIIDLPVSVRPKLLKNSFLALHHFLGIRDVERIDLEIQIWQQRRVGPNGIQLRVRVVQDQNSLQVQEFQSDKFLQQSTSPTAPLTREEVEHTTSYL